MSTNSSDSEDSWLLLGKASESGGESCSSAEFVKVNNTSVSYHHKNKEDDDTLEELDAANSQSASHEHFVDDVELIGAEAESQGVNSKCGDDLKQETHDCVEDERNAMDNIEKATVEESMGTEAVDDSMFSCLGERGQDSLDSDDSDRFSADFLGRSGLELRRQASASDSDSDFVRIEVRHGGGEIMQSSGGSSISPNFHFLNQARQEDEDSLAAGDVDDRCESDLSLVDDTEDLSSVSLAVADMAIHEIPVIRNYRQKPNSNLNFCLSVMAACVLCIAIGLGIGHAIGSAREASFQYETRQGQQERLRVLQDDLLMCLQKQEDMDTTIVKLTEIERLLKDADYWREEYEKLLKIKLKNEENWKREKESLSRTLSASTPMAPSSEASAPEAGFSHVTEKRQLLSVIQENERHILNLKMKLDMQTAITKEHIAHENSLQRDVDHSVDTKHSLQSEVSILKVEKENLEEKLLAEDQDDIVLESTISDLQTENKDLKVKLTHEAEDTQQLEEKIAILQTMLSQEAMDDLDLEHKIANLQAELSREAMDDLDLETQVINLKDEIQKLRKIIDQISQEDNMTQLIEVKTDLESVTDIGQCTGHRFAEVIQQIGGVSSQQVEVKDEDSPAIPYQEDRDQQLIKSKAAILDLTDSLKKQSDRDAKVIESYSMRCNMLVNDVRKYRQSSYHYQALYNAAKEKPDYRNNSRNITPSFFNCMSMLVNCTTCSEADLWNMTEPLQSHLLYLLNATRNSEFLEFLQQKRSKFESSAEFQQFLKHFQTAYTSMQDSLQSSWHRFQDTANSKEFKDSTKKAKKTMKDYWSKIRDSSPFENLKDAAKKTSRAFQNVSQKMSDKVQKTVNGLRNFTSSPLLQDIYNSTKNAMLSLEFPKQTWKEIKQFSKQFSKSHDLPRPSSVVSDVYKSVKESISQRWNQVKEKCKYKKRDHRSYEHSKAKEAHHKKSDSDDDDDHHHHGNGDRKFKEKYHKYIVYLHSLNGQKFQSMDKKERKDFYENLEDFEDDYRKTISRLGKQMWFKCQLKWWKTLLKGDELELSKNCQEELMRWQISMAQHSLYLEHGPHGHHEMKEAKRNKDEHWVEGTDMKKNKTQANWYFHRAEDREDRRHDAKWYFRRHHHHNHHHGDDPHDDTSHNTMWMERRAKGRAHHHHKNEWMLDRACQRQHQRRHERGGLHKVYCDLS